MFDRFQQRSTDLERLDTGEYTPEEYLRWQREMKFIHGILGEERALRNTLFREIEASNEIKLSVIDVGAGSGGLLKKLANWTLPRDVFLVGAEIDGTAARSIKDRKIAALQCDALQLPFTDNAFDYSFCSLFLHHLDDVRAVSLIKEMARVASNRVYVIDLNRHPLAYYFYNFFGWFVLQRFTLEDGSLSILRSRTPGELFEIARMAGLKDIRVEHSRVNRLILSGI